MYENFNTVHVSYMAIKHNFKSIEDIIDIRQ